MSKAAGPEKQWIYLPRPYWRNILVQSQKLYGWQNHYVTGTLLGRMASYGELKQTCTFENHDNLLAYLTNWPPYTPENGFRGIVKRQSGPFLSFAQAFSVLIVRINCQNGVPLKHGFVYCRLCNYGRGHIDDPPMLLCLNIVSWNSCLVYKYFLWVTWCVTCRWWHKHMLRIVYIGLKGLVNSESL